MEKILAACVALICLVTVAPAQLIVDTSHQAPMGRGEIGGATSFSKIDYKTNDSLLLGDSKAIKRFVLGGYAAFGMTEKSDLFGTVGLILNAEGDDASDSGSGFLLAGGGRIDVMDIADVDLSAYAQLEIIVEDYGSESDGNLMEIAVGVVGKTALNEQIDVFAAFDLFPFSDGNIDVGPRSADFERDSLFGVRMGGSLDLGDFWLRGELALIGEVTVTIGAGTYF